MDEQLNKEAIYNRRAEVITAIITSYSNQIEDYEKRNYGECMMCVSFCAAILAAIGAFLMAAPSNGINAEEAKLVIAFVIMLIPVVITIFLYNFAMNCRRSAVLRGYMQFLEECLNKVLYETSMSYHGALFLDEIVPFPVNAFGPAALSVGLAALFLTCAIWSHNLYKQSQLTEAGYVVFFWFALIICSGCSFLFAVALMRNNQAVKRSKETCRRRYRDSFMQADETEPFDADRAFGERRRKSSFWCRIGNVIKQKIGSVKSSEFIHKWSRW